MNDQCPKNATTIPTVMNNDGFQTVVNKKKSGKTGSTIVKTIWQPMNQKGRFDPKSHGNSKLSGDKKSIEERCEQIRSAIESSTSDYREKFQERLAKLSSGVPVLKIGGASDTEVDEKKDIVMDALNATKAAVEEGIVPGGGVALLYASKELDKLQTTNFDQKTRVQIIQFQIYCIVSMAYGLFGCVVTEPPLDRLYENQSQVGLERVLEALFVVVYVVKLLELED
ncbi:chaperonin CPN60-2, mitochondrial-like protein [Tanacetum coccineum]|uniref:Chaperonin CPN60-2, mitochondrial-like protein n=1 Tax=Tanacetum coccineum TaxID=301880 RepID=A0ABQ5BWL7_9ASTR